MHRSNTSTTMLYKFHITSVASESRPEASSHGYWIHQLDTQKTAHVNFTYVWPTLLRKLNHKYNSLLFKYYEYFLFFPSYQLANVLMKIYDRHHSRTRCPLRTVSTMSSTTWEIKMHRERFCTIKGIQYYGCACKSEINHWCSVSNFSLL